MQSALVSSLVLLSSSPIHTSAVDRTDLSYIPCLCQRFWATSCWPEGLRYVGGWVQVTEWRSGKTCRTASRTGKPTQVVRNEESSTCRAASRHILFGSTYACEQSFPHLKNIKSNLRSRLTDGSPAWSVTSPHINQPTEQNHAAAEE